MDNYHEEPFSFEARTISIIKKINFLASQCSLWQRAPAGKKTLLSASSMLPVINFTPEVLESIYTESLQESSQTAFGGFLVGSKHNPSHYLTVTINELQWNARTPRSSGDYIIRLFSRDILETDKREFQFILQSLMFKLDSYAEFEYLEPLDLCKAALSFGINEGRLRANCQLLFPYVNLQFVQISMLKIVSTPLSIQLTQKTDKKAKFQTGYLTLDQKKRALPLLCSDPLAFRYPLVGVWVSGAAGDHTNPLAHPLVWAACVRFIESKLIQGRISPNPEKNTFLFANFSSKPAFYEVSTQEKPAWCIANSIFELKSENGSFSSETCTFLKGNQSNKEAEQRQILFTSDYGIFTSPKTDIRKPRKTTSPSISSDGYSSIKDMAIRSPRSSLETCNGISAENLILEQAEMLRRLEKQIQELQSQICYTQLESPKPKFQSARTSPKMVNSSTNTTIDKKSISGRTLFNENQSASTNTSFLHKDRPKRPPRIPRLPNLRFSTEGSESSENSPKSSFSFPAPALSARSSHFTESLSNPPKLPPKTQSSSCGNSDTTIAVPKIMYESSSDTSEDDDIKKLQKKYLKT